MSHLHDASRDRLPVPGHPHLWVEFKREASFHDELKVEQYRDEVLSRAQRDEFGERRLDAYLIADFVVAKAAVMVADWNLADDKGATLPINKESLMKLSADVLRFIGDASAARFAGRPEAKEGPFGKPSPPSSPPARARKTRR